MQTTIVVDAMGADRHPKPEVEGAILATRHSKVRVILVGQQDLIRAELNNHSGASSLPIEIVHASEHISMHDKAAQAVRQKRDSSMRVGLRLVREGKAHGFVSAGNTGAMMATTKMVLGALPGVDRPALAAVFRNPFHRRRRVQGQRTHSRKLQTAQHPSHQLHWQRRRS